ncbi:MAG: hypothetical protein Q9187_002746 [Circinaria calcarea]
MPPKPPLTHFLCLPLVNPLSKPQLQASVQQFITDVTVPSSHNEITIPHKAIRPLGTLHLTLGVMSLLSPQRVASALEFLQGIDVLEVLRRASGAVLPEGGTEAAVDEGGVIDAAEQPETDSQLSTGLSRSESLSQGEKEGSPPPLIVSLYGLRPMHEPTSTSILYAPPTDATSRLYPFCVALCNAFTEAGFLIPDSRPLRLHATIVNTIYAKEKTARKKGGGHGKDRMGARGFDAKQLLERYEGFVWAEDIRLDRICICEMGAKAVEKEEGEEVEYVEIGSLPLP